MISRRQFLVGCAATIAGIALGKFNSSENPPSKRWDFKTTQRPFAPAVVEWKSYGERNSYYYSYTITDNKGNLWRCSGLPNAPVWQIINAAT